MKSGVLKEIQKKKSLGIKSMAVLIDPDHSKLRNFETTLELARKFKVDYFFIGGSLVLQDRMDECIRQIRELCNIPIVIFPGNNTQIHTGADALLLLSLISGRNADYLIGKHVESAMQLYTSKLEIISTGYLLIDGGHSNTAAYISQTLPIPADKAEVALATAMAAQLLNHQMIYLDSGSGAQFPVPVKMIEKIHEYIQIPIIVGGGLRNEESVVQCLQAGADLVVIGNVFEKDPQLIQNLMHVVRGFSPLQLNR